MTRDYVWGIELHSHEEIGSKVFCEFDSRYNTVAALRKVALINVEFQCKILLQYKIFLGWFAG